MKLLFILLLAPIFCTAQKDTAYWNHIAKHSRFRFIKSDAVDSGIVYKVIREKDGDAHVVLFTYQQTKTGYKKLVCEVICAYKKTGECAGYTNNTVLPIPGQFIRVYGDLVYDRLHKWEEIHPVKRIIIKK